tara:strand:+ start:5145 stop:5432 length:288 start_codon:yes stop_codon:yes gene_type:complete
VDQFSDLQADIKSIIGGENRLNTMIQYTSPETVNLVSLNVAVRPGEDAENDEGDDGISFSVIFETEVLYAALAYDQDLTFSWLMRASRTLTKPTY